MSSYQSIVGSVPFTFVIGPERKEIHLHPALVSQHSKPLSALINGHMIESKSREAFLEDVDVATFVRCSEYFYTGNYTAADPTPIPDSTTNSDQTPTSELDPVTSAALPARSKLEGMPAFAEAEPEVELHEVPDDIFYLPTGTKKGKKNKSHWDISSISPKPTESKDAKLWRRFVERTYDDDHPVAYVKQYRDDSSQYADVLLCHAQVYLFAEKYDIGRLRCVALHYLQDTLTNFTPNSGRALDFAVLFDYVYQNTAERTDTMDPMRELVVHYAACHVTKLVHGELFQQVLTRGDCRASVDLLQQLMERLD